MRLVAVTRLRKKTAFPALLDTVLILWRVSASVSKAKRCKALEA